MCESASLANQTNTPLSHWQKWGYPLICPNCGHLMRITGILENPDDAVKLLCALGWLAYATDCQGARAPPPGADPDAPELPFTSDCDGIAYELEPWEKARQQRLQQYAQLRDQVAGIVVYDGDGNDANAHHTEADAWPQSIDESQAPAFPETIDPRPPQWAHKKGSVQFSMLLLPDLPKPACLLHPAG